MKYDVIYASNLKGLCDTTNKFLAEGWKLQGGIATLLVIEKLENDISPKPVVYFYQAITKDTLVVEGVV